MNFKVDNLVLLFDSSNGYIPIAFRAFSTFSINNAPKKTRILYVEGTAVDPKYQGHGIYQEITRRLIPDFDFIVSRTQSPVVATALSRIFSEVYPLTSEPTNNIKLIAKFIADYLEMPSYDYDKMTGRRTYQGILTEKMPKIENEMKKIVIKKIKPEEGDCLILVCPI